MEIQLAGEPKSGSWPARRLHILAARRHSRFRPTILSEEVTNMAKKNKKSANTPKPAKPPGKAAKKAADAATQDGLGISRAATNSREEIRQQTPQRQGHPK